MWIQTNVWLQATQFIYLKNLLFFCVHRLNGFSSDMLLIVRSTNVNKSVKICYVLHCSAVHCIAPTGLLFTFYRIYFKLARNSKHMQIVRVSDWYPTRRDKRPKEVRTKRTVCNTLNCIFECVAVRTVLFLLLTVTNFT